MGEIGYLRSRDLSSALGFVADLERAHDVPALRALVVHGLRELVAADSVTYTEIDTVSGEARWWTDPVNLGEGADPEPFVAYLHQHPIAAHHATRGGQDAVQFSDFLTRRELERLELFNDFYKPLEVDHQLAIAIDAPGGLSIPISAQRRRRAFGERARALLALLHPHLTAAYRRLDDVQRGRSLLAALDAHRDSDAIVLERDGSISVATSGARARLARYAASATDPDALPARLADALIVWRARGAPDAERPAAVMPSLQLAGAEGSLTVRYLPSVEHGHDGLLIEEVRAAPSPSDLRPLGLTPRQTEVLAGACRGGSVQAIAEELVISPRTAQKHLQNIFERLGVHSRGEAVALAYRAVRRGPDG